MKIIFAGTPVFAEKALSVLHQTHQVVAVLTQPDRPSGRGMQLTASPVKQFALRHGLTVLQPESLKGVDIQQMLAEFGADVMVVAAYGLILPQTVLSMPRYGCLNIHASLLPRWRGAAPIQRAILAGDAETGITIMQMDAGLDTGDMLLRHACRIEATDNAAMLHDKLAELGAASIIEALQLLAQGRLTPLKQDDAAATYAAKLLKAEGRMDWSLDAMQLGLAVRAFNPFPVCHTLLGDVPIKVWQAAPAMSAGEPGVVLEVDKQGITVACGNGSLRLEMLQRPGGKAQSAAQFLQAVPIKPGDRFQ